MGLNLVLGICCFRDAVGEGNIDFVELVPHLIGSHYQQCFNVFPEFGGGSPLTLGAQNVIISELGPGFWH